MLYFAVGRRGAGYTRTEAFRDKKEFLEFAQDIDSDIKDNFTISEICEYLEGCIPEYSPIVGASYITQVSKKEYEELNYFLNTY